MAVRGRVRSRSAALAGLYGLSLMTLGACSDLSQPVLVAIGDETFSADDLRRVYADIEPSNRPPLVTREQRVAFVDLFIERRLLAEEGERRLAGDEAAHAELDRGRDEVLLKRLRVVESAHRTVTAEAIEEARGRMAWTRTGTRVPFASREAAEVARRELQIGTGLERLTRDRFGGVVVTGDTLVWSPLPQPLADAVVDLDAGEVSEPIEIAGVWWILRVDTREPRTVPEAEGSDTQVAQGLQFRHRVESDRDLGRRLREQAELVIEASTVERLARRTSEAILADGATEHDPEWALPVLTSEELDLPLASWRGGGTWTAADYLDALRRTGRAQRPRSGPLTAAVTRTVEGEVTRHLLLDEALRRRLDEDWWVRSSVASGRTERLIQLAIDGLQTGGRPDPARADSLADILLEAQPELFRQEPAVRVARFDFPTRDAAERERERIRRAGGSQGRIAEILAGDPGFEGIYFLVFLSQGGVNHGELERFLFEEPPGELGGPFTFGEGWTLVECLERMDTESLSADQMRAQVIARLSSNREAETVPDWVRARRGEVGVVVDVEGLDVLAPGR